MNKKLYIIILVLLTLSSFNSCKEPTPIVDNTSTEELDPSLNKLMEEIKKSPENALLYKKRANYYIGLEAYDEAIEDLKKSIQLDSLDPLVYHQLSDVYMDYYQSRQALRTMRDVLDIYPYRIPSLLKYTEFLFILKQYDQALVTIDKIAKLDGQNAEAAFMLGLILLEMDDINGATSAFKKATTFDSQLTDAWMMLGEIYERENKPLAKVYYKNAMRSDSNNVSAIHAMAYYLQNHGSIEEAIDLYEKIISKNKLYEPAYLNVGILHLEQKNYTSALENFNILTSMNPKAHLAYYFKGVCLEALGNIASAKDNYQNCLNFKPDYKDAQSALDRLK